MNDRLRDGLLASAATVAVVAAGRSAGVAPASLVTPRGLASGVAGAGGALALELAMARRPDVARRLWADRRVRWGGTLIVAVAVPVAVAVGGFVLAAPVVAALLGGLAAYFALLAGVLSGALAPPETWFERREQVREPRQDRGRE